MEENYLPINKWDKDDKPREKLLAKGKKALSNSELIGILLGSGTTKISAISVAQNLLDKAGNSIVALSKKDISELKKVKGVGDAKAVTIMAALELGSRMWAEQRNSDEVFIKDSTTIYNVIAPHINDLPHEEFWVMYLSNSHKLLDRKRISIGGLTATTVDVRVILKSALEKNCTYIALAHNHPSGSVKPSKEDIALTKKIQEACQIMDIKLLDHVIVGEHFSSGDCNYYSFFDNGRL